MLGKIWEVIKAILSWSWKNKQPAVIIALILMLMLQTKCTNDKIAEIDKLKAEKVGLEDKLKAKIEVGSGGVKIIYRTKPGEVKYIDRYLPPEGYVKKIEYEKQKSKLQNIKDKALTTKSLDALRNFITGTVVDTEEGKIIIVDKGFTFRPGFGAFYNGGYNEDIVSPAIDFKLVFFKRYSAGLGSSLVDPYLWISRHIDDVVPLIKPRNVEFTLGYGKPYADFEHNIFKIGLRTNF